MAASANPPAIESDALRANLAETAWEARIEPRLLPLREPVAAFQGIVGKLDHLLAEISHPYRNWNVIAPELRAFVLKNSKHYFRAEQGPACLGLFFSVFFEALEDSLKNRQLAYQVVEAMLALTEKLVRTAAPADIGRFQQPLDLLFGRLGELDEDTMLLVVQGQHPMKRLAEQLLLLSGHEECRFDCAGLRRLFARVLEINYGYWLSEEDPYTWFLEQGGGACMEGEAAELLGQVSHARLEECRRELAEAKALADPRAALERLVGLPAHMDIVRLYRRIPGRLCREQRERASAVEEGEYRKLLFLFLFRIMDTPGLSLIHEETLREINRSLVHLIRNQGYEEIERFFTTTISLLKANVRKFPHTSLQCIQVIGNEVFKRGSSRIMVFTPTKIASLILRIR